MSELNVLSTKFQADAGFHLDAIEFLAGDIPPEWLTFDDLLELRKMHETIAAIYNDIIDRENHADSIVETV